MIHSKGRWPKAIEDSLWPCALTMANNVINYTPNLRDQEKRSPASRFYSTTVEVNPKHWKPFGCPVYVLNEALQSGNIYSKWKKRSRVGIYLGQSPKHGRNVALVLNLETGHVSPQFHVAFDNGFHTVKQEDFQSLWQVKTGFRRGATCLLYTSPSPRDA